MIARLYYALAPWIRPEAAYWTLLAAILWVGVGVIVWTVYAAHAMGWKDSPVLPALARGFVHGLAWPLYLAGLLVGV